jgi:hypothetical protein
MKANCCEGKHSLPNVTAICNEACRGTTCTLMFEVLTTVKLRIQVFWDVTAYHWASFFSISRTVVPSSSQLISPSLKLLDK